VPALPRISGRCPSRRPVARQPSPSEPARSQAVDRCHVFGYLLDPEGSESPLSPHSHPMRLDPEGSRFRLSPHSVPLEFLLVPGRAGSAQRNSDSCPRHVRGGRNSMGTRPEPIGICVATAEAADQAVPRFDGYGVPPRRPVPNRIHHPYKGARLPPKRDAFKGENPGSFRGVQVRRLSRRRGFRGRRDGRASTPRTPPGREWGRDP
jgi:hypothetical protein